jgi:hypothetical protein
MDSLLQKPEYVHVALNHLPVVGLGVSAVALSIAMLAKSRGATLGCMLLALIMAASVWPVVESGESAYNRIRAVSDPDGASILRQHMNVAERWAWIYYATALVTAISMLVAWKKPRFINLAGVAVVGLSLCAVAVGVRVAKLGGEVRHPEFRSGTNMIPQNIPRTHDHAHGHEH